LTVTQKLRESWEVSGRTVKYSFSKQRKNFYPCRCLHRSSHKNHLAFS